MPHVMDKAQTRLTVLVSGNGSNLQALIDACSSGALQNCEIVRVLSNKKDAYGLTRAKNAKIATVYHNIVQYKTKHPQSDPSKREATQAARDAYDSDLAEVVLKDSPDLVICAGFMHVLSANFLRPLAHAGVEIINLHPSLPGDDLIVGAHAIRDAHEQFQKGQRARTGVMIHYVILDVDKGAPIEAQEVALRKDEPLESFEQRVHAVEHVAIVEGTRKAVKSLQEKRTK